jgi:transposase
MTGARISDFVTGAPHSQSASFANIDEWGKLANGAPDLNPIENVWRIVKREIA